MNKIVDILKTFVAIREKNNNVIKNQLIVMKTQNRKM